MEFWFSEQQTPNVKLSIRVDRQLYSGRSEFQRIDVFDSPEFGRFLTLDGYMMLTEKDEFIYHEMITHVPMAVHPHVEKVLVIGAGDGGVIRELVQYHISGQLKVAPEHVSDAVLARMGKPRNAVYNQFVEKYFALNRQYGMNQYLVPYLMSSHPGSTLKEAVELADVLGYDVVWQKRR